MKFDREQWKMVIALVVVAVVATAALGFTDLATHEKIEAAKGEAMARALSQILPAFANDPQAETVDFGVPSESVRIYPGKDASGQVTGLAWAVVAPDGYSGKIRILIAVRPDGLINAIRVTEHKETPGLGDLIVSNRQWVDSFAGRGLTGTRWAVKKDGGDFDQFTGATISPRAVVKAVKRGLEYFGQHRDEILAAVAAPKRAQAEKGKP